MNTIEENRRNNLKALVDEYGTQVALSNVIKKSTAQISQWINASKYANSEKRRAMESTTAREIEKLTGKSQGWLDQPASSQGNTPNEIFSLSSQELRLIEILRSVDDVGVNTIMTIAESLMTTQKTSQDISIPKRKKA